MFAAAATAWVILAGALTPPPPSDATEASVTQWVRAYLDTEDWYNTTFNSNFVRFTAAEGMSRLADDRLRIWIRTEYFRPQYSEGDWYRSTMTLVEMDCAEGRFRELALDTYDHNNIKGAQESWDIPDATWQYPRPATVAALEIKDVCALKAAVDSAPPADDAAPAGEWRVIE